jgi:RIO kinase 1
VEHDHPAAFDFLRADIKNVDEFWARRGAKTLGLRGTFDFIVSDKVIPSTSPHEETDAALRTTLTALIEVKSASAEPRGHERADAAESKMNSTTTTHAPTVLSRADIQRLEDERSALAIKGADEQLDDAVFLRSYIPRNLNEVFDPERDAAKVRRGEGSDLIYGGITGVVEANQPSIRTEIRGDPGRTASGQKPDVHIINEESSDGESDGDEDDEAEEDGDNVEWSDKKRAPRGHRHEDKDAKKVRDYWIQRNVLLSLAISKERKKAVKEEARERRKTKLPKAEKKKRIKQTSSKG